jgi:hypothetical protein
MALEALTACMASLGAAGQERGRAEMAALAAAAQMEASNLTAARRLLLEVGRREGARLVQGAGATGHGPATGGANAPQDPGAPALTVPGPAA